MSILKAQTIAQWSDRALLFCLLITLFFLPMSIAIIESFSVAMLVFFVFKKVANKSFKIFVDTPLNCALIAMCVAIILSAFFGVDYHMAIKKFFGKFLQLVLLYFVVIETVRTPQRLRWIMNILLLSATLVITDALWQYFGKQSFVLHKTFDGRINGVFGHANDLGTYLTTIIPIVWAALSFYPRALIMAMLAAAVAALGLTFSRGGWMAFLVGTGTLSAMTFNVRKFFLTLVIIILFLFGFFYFARDARQNETAKEIKSSNPVVELVNFFGFASRIPYWKSASTVVANYPVFGCGYNGYVNTAKRLTLPPYEYPHNVFLHIASETGLVGLAAFLWLLVAYFYSCFTYIRRVKDAQARRLTVGFMVAFLCFIVHSSVDTAYTSIQLSTLMWFVLGLGIAVQNMYPIQEREK